MSRHSVSSFLFINVIKDVSTKGYANNVKNKANESNKPIYYVIYTIFLFKFTCLDVLLI